MRFLCLIALSLHTTFAAELICAGGSEVFIIDAAKAEAGTIEKVWRWSGKDAPDLPEDARRAFEHLDECKPVDHGAKLLICASNGGCAMIERATKRVLWRVHARNAHSLTLLPHDRIVVASSLSGDHLEVFDLKGNDAPIFKTPLHSAHGLVWDEQRQCLWALGFDELRAYTLQHWESGQPSLVLKSTHKLPDEDGHDLRPVPDSSDLVLSTEHGVHLFDRDKATFRPHPTFAAEQGVKSVDIDPASGRTVLGQWRRIARLFQPDGRIEFKDTIPYKLRWMP